MTKRVFIVLSIVFLFLGCSKKNDNTSVIRITDMEGTQVELPKDINRVACISQSATDFMIAFGLGEKIAGTYRSFTYNTWTQELYPPAANLQKNC